MEQNIQNTELVHSLGEAERIAKIMILRNDIDGLYGLRDVVLSGDISGTANEFHNFSVNFASRGDHESACEILQIGLKQHPLSTDLLADFLQYGIKCGKSENAKQYYERLMQIPIERWTWRSFDFSIDYLKAETALLSDHEEIEKKKEQMLFLADSFHRQMPYDEQPFLAKAEIFEFFGDAESFTSTLKTAITSIKIAPKCCLKYGDLMLERGEYEEVIAATRQGIIASAQEQESISTGYLFYISALAKDAIIHKNEAYHDENAIHDAYSDYKIAQLLLDKGRIAYRENIDIRTLILSIKSGIPYSAEEQNNREKEEA